MKTSVKIGKAVQERRSRLGWTQEQLARRADVSAGYISKLERGMATEGSITHLSLVANALGVPMSALTGDDDAMGASPVEALVQSLGPVMPDISPEEAERFAQILALLDEHEQQEVLVYALWRYTKWQERMEAEKRRVPPLPEPPEREARAGNGGGSALPYLPMMG